MRERQLSESAGERAAPLLGLLMGQMYLLSPGPPRAEWLGPGVRDVTKEGQACLFAGSHPRIYGAALERESLTKIYGPAYLLGVVPTHDTERPCRSHHVQQIYGSFSWLEFLHSAADGPAAT